MGELRGEGNEGLSLRVRYGFGKFLGLSLGVRRDGGVTARLTRCSQAVFFEL
jgi:hypothetical protein